MNNLKVGKGGLPPPGLNAIQRKRGQAALPNPETLHLESNPAARHDYQRAKHLIRNLKLLKMFLGPLVQNVKTPRPRPARVTTEICLPNSSRVLSV